MVMPTSNLLSEMSQLKDAVLLLNAVMASSAEEAAVRSGEAVRRSSTQKLEETRKVAEKTAESEKKLYDTFVTYESLHLKDEQKASLKRIDQKRVEIAQILKINNDMLKAKSINIDQHARVEAEAARKVSQLNREAQFIADPTKIDSVTKAFGSMREHADALGSVLGLRLGAFLGGPGGALLAATTLTGYLIKVNTELREISKTVIEMRGLAVGLSTLDLRGGKGEIESIGKGGEGMFFPELMRLSMRYQIRRDELLRDAANLTRKGGFDIDREVPGVLEEAITMGSATGLGRQTVEENYIRMHMNLGIATKKLKDEFAELYSIAKQTGTSIEQYMDNTLKLAESTKLYGIELADVKIFTHLFAKELAESKLSLSDMTNLLTGSEGLGEGVKAFLAQTFSAEDWTRMGKKGITPESDIHAQIRAFTTANPVERLFVLLETSMPRIFREMYGEDLKLFWTPEEKEANREEYERHAELRDRAFALSGLKFDPRKMDEIFDRIAAKRGGLVEFRKEIAALEKEKPAKALEVKGTETIIEHLSWIRVFLDAVFGGAAIARELGEIKLGRAFGGARGELKELKESGYTAAVVERTQERITSVKEEMIRLGEEITPKNFERRFKKEEWIRQLKSDMPVSQAVIDDAVRVILETDEASENLRSVSQKTKDWFRAAQIRAGVFSIPSLFVPEAIKGNLFTEEDRKQQEESLLPQTTRQRGGFIQADEFARLHKGEAVIPATAVDRNYSVINNLLGYSAEQSNLSSLISERSILQKQSSSNISLNVDLRDLYFTSEGASKEAMAIAIDQGMENVANRLKEEYYQKKLLEGANIF